MKQSVHPLRMGIEANASFLVYGTRMPPTSSLVVMGIAAK